MLGVALMRTAADCDPFGTSVTREGAGGEDVLSVAEAAEAPEVSMPTMALTAAFSPASSSITMGAPRLSMKFLSAAR